MVIVLSYRRRAAWLSLVAVLLGVGVVPALHRVVHELEEHDDHDHDHAPRRPQPQRRAGHAESHRHVGAGPHAHAHARRVAAEVPPLDSPRRHHHHHEGGGPEGDPLQHGRGALEHLGVALLASTPPLVPPSPVPTLAPPPPAPLAGCLPREASRPSTIRGPPSARSSAA